LHIKFQNFPRREGSKGKIELCEGKVEREEKVKENGRRGIEFGPFTKFWINH